MTVYIPVYDRCRKVEAVEAELLKPFANSNVCRWKPNVGFYGDIYNRDTIFMSEEAAWRYWRREGNKQEDHYRIEG